MAKSRLIDTKWNPYTPKNYQAPRTDLNPVSQPIQKEKQEPVNELLIRARQLLPDYTLCKRCGKPLYNLLSVHRGIGGVCELREATEIAETEPNQNIFRSQISYRGRMRRVK